MVFFPYRYITSDRPFPKPGRSLIVPILYDEWGIHMNTPHYTICITLPFSGHRPLFLKVSHFSFFFLCRLSACFFSVDYDNYLLDMSYCHCPQGGKRLVFISYFRGLSERTTKSELSSFQRDPSPAIVPSLA